MQETYAKLVHCVVDYGLGLRERLRRGEQPVIEDEQGRLKDLLTPAEAASGALGAWDATVGMPAIPRSNLGTSVDGARNVSASFLGIRYALVCWLDEMFCQGDDEWAGRWNERKLEVKLYDSNDRAWRFWEQASLAQARAGSDALEVFYLCVMLGFRGEMRDDPEKLQSWANSVRRRLGDVHQPQWRYATELPPRCGVPPLRGRQRLLRMITTGWLYLLVFIPVLAFWIVRQIGES